MSTKSGLRSIRGRIVEATLRDRHPVARIVRDRPTGHRQGVLSEPPHHAHPFRRRPRGTEVLGRLLSEPVLPHRPGPPGFGPSRSARGFSHTRSIPGPPTRLCGRPRQSTWKCSTRSGATTRCRTTKTRSSRPRTSPASSIRTPGSGADVPSSGQPAPFRREARPSHAGAGEIVGSGLFRPGRHWPRLSRSVRPPYPLGSLCLSRSAHLQSLRFRGAWPTSQSSFPRCWRVAATSPPKRMARAVR